MARTVTSVPRRASPSMVPDSSAVPALVGDPIVVDAARGWTVGHAVAPTGPDPAAVRAARLEARLAVYAQYAAVVAEEAAAAMAGEDERRAELTAARGAAAEHFAELRAVDGGEGAGAMAQVAFADALSDALLELRHQHAVDNALARQLRALRGAHAPALPPALPVFAPSAALPAGERAAPRLDLRF